MALYQLFGAPAVPISWSYWSWRPVGSSDAFWAPLGLVSQAGGSINIGAITGPQVKILSQGIDGPVKRRGFNGQRKYTLLLQEPVVQNKLLAAGRSPFAVASWVAAKGSGAIRLRHMPTDDVFFFELKGVVRNRLNSADAIERIAYRCYIEDGDQPEYVEGMGDEPLVKLTITAVPSLAVDYIGVVDDEWIYPATQTAITATGGTATTIICTTGITVNDQFNGCFACCLETTPGDGANKGKVALITESVASTHTCTVMTDDTSTFGFPDAVASGDTFKLCLPYPLT